MAYKVILTGKVRKQIETLSRSAWARVRIAIDGLETDPRPPGAVKMKGPFDTWRIRVGVYRVLYVIEDERLVVLVVNVGHRREVYR
ncbi:MAG: type II toxin-antitoxin system RelE/ParE family toxin [Magnetococcales bacterium]|nr:type II toxin-antitoxin system RelE/ParE family toxin [Magnetococcales bacterium]MBF0149019.1 type II toxin-antitoxin system RelE/ParE family toxin [Magnetococcales bacterium]MBF0630327.1 type II toxin-antitoxin system RelE/ParE family toxin [Magnetococcales bacterium]